MSTYPTTPVVPLNCDRDPARWAREFNEAAATQRYPYDEGFLIGWFANAMMCGEDTYRWRQEAKARSETHPTTQLPMGDPHPCDMTPDEREKFFACTDDKPLQPLKVRTKFLGQGDLYDLYLGDTYLGRFGLDAVVPLANAITNAVSVHPSTPTDKRVSAHDHGNCELCDQLERELAEAQDDCRRLHREKMDALFGPDGKPRSASEPIELLREIQRYLSANKILRPLDWQCRVDAILRAAADSASTKR